MYKLQQETKDEAARLYQEGHPVQEIKETLGIRADETIYRILEEHGIKPERKQASKKGARRMGIILSPEAARLLQEASPRNISAWISAQIVKVSGADR